MNETIQTTESHQQVAASRYAVQVAPAKLTRLLIYLNLAVYLAVLLIGILNIDVRGPSLLSSLTDYISTLLAIIMGSYYPPTATPDLLALGMKENWSILNGETWRLLTATFLHLGPLHIAFNLFALNALGPMVEGYFGHLRFAFIYIISGLYGSLASYAFSAAPSAGASGAVFGLAGAITVYFIRYRNNFGERGQSILQSMLVVILLNLVFGLSVSGIDNWGHMGGLAGGIAAAWGILPRYSRPAPTAFGQVLPLAEEKRTVWELLWALCIVALFLAGLQGANQITPISGIVR